MINYKEIETKFGVKFPDYSGKVQLMGRESFRYDLYTNGGAWVSILKNSKGNWYYIRLNNVSESREFDDLQECINVAYRDMIASKL